MLAGLTLYLLNFDVELDKQKPELLVYCGTTMVRPMLEIAGLMEQQENVKVSIIQGGSGNLLQAIRFNRVGDLYLPGSRSYIRKAEEQGLVKSSLLVGYNKAVMLVAKGNPKSIQPDLNEFLSKQHYIVLGNPESGSIGRETSKMLKKAGIYEKAMHNARELATDSKRLMLLLKNGQADLVVNWLATAMWEENRDHVSVLPIDEQYAQPKLLYLGLLTTARDPELAGRFVHLAISQRGRKIFERYGLWQESSGR